MSAVILSLQHEYNALAKDGPESSAHVHRPWCASAILCDIVGSRSHRYDARVPWRVEILNEIVAAEIAALPADMQPRFLRLAARIASVGLESLREAHVEHLDRARSHGRGYDLSRIVDQARGQYLRFAIRTSLKFETSVASPY